VGKRLTYVLNIAARAMTKHALNVHAGHDDYHAIDDTGFFQLFAKDAQEAADLNLIAHRIAELALNPGVLAQDGFLTSHVIESMRMPERALVREFLGDPADMIESPTPAQRWVFGDTRRRIPELFDVDYPAMLGVVQNQDAYQQGVAAQRPFYFDHLPAIADRVMGEYAALTGRRYARATGYRLEDAEWVLVGQGSVVANAEVVADHLRATRGLRVGVLNVTMFRPFPADVITGLLRGKRGVTVLERVDQPLAVDQPLLREIRAAVSKAVENGRAGNGRPPYPGVAVYQPEDAPDFYSGTFGLGSRDLQPADLIAAVDNMLEGGARARQFYLGIDFVRPGTRLPKLQIWQERVLESYPHVAGLSLPPAAPVNLLPRGATSIRIHSVGGWGAITMGKTLAMTAADLFGLCIKANPKYGSEKKGQPTTFYATLAREPIRLNCELHHVNVVLAPDPNVFRHSDPLSGLEPDGVFIIQSDTPAAELWGSLPAEAQRAILERRIRLFTLNAFKIATEEASDPELRYRMQGVAFMGAFFKAAGLMEQAGLDETALFAGITKQLEKKFGKLGARVVEDNLRVIRRGFDEVSPIDTAALTPGAAEGRAAPQMPALLEQAGVRPGVADAGRFWEQVCFLYKTGGDGIADPFAALSAIPAATSVIRDMTDVRFEVPDFVAENCTGCGQCWVQCPDAAIPGLVTEVDDLLRAALRVAGESRSFERLPQLVKPLGTECRKLLGGAPLTSFGSVLTEAYRAVTARLDLDPERRATLDREFTALYAAVAEFPLARTKPFFDVPAARDRNAGGLLSITVNPDACKGCNICVRVCPDDALRTVPQTPEIVERLRRNWKLWEQLPDTPDRYVNVSNLEEGIGVLASLLLKKATYRSMVGGDGACMGCGEKTVAHLVLSAVNALMLPRVERYVARLDELIAGLDAKARGLLAADADLHALGGEADAARIVVAEDRKAAVGRLSRMIDELKDLRWRYTEGPSGRGRATMAMANATGCSSVWGSTYPYNPYPFPWVNHLFQDAPSIAIGIFEGHMRKMADGFRAVRRAELEFAGNYDANEHEPFLTRFDWHHFSDDEFAMCPPIFATGGDGAMLDIGFQNLSRLLASGKPIRVMVLDTQVYSNTGGQACTSGFLGQVSDMAAYGKAQHGKTETRKELALLTLAHRNVFLLQSSQAAPSHLLAGVLRGLQSRYPAVFALHCPCPPEHGLGDDQSPDAAKLALESRSYPLVVYDPAAGVTLAERLSLDGNPSADDPWPEYELKYRDADGTERMLTLPVTTADWAATEVRFKRHFTPLPGDTEDGLTPFHEYVAAAPDDREGRQPFIHVLERDGTLGRLAVADEIVRLAEDRLAVWGLLKEMAGVETTATDAAAADLAAQLDALRAEYDRKIADLKAQYPALVARRLAEGLMRAGNGQRTIADLLQQVQQTPGLTPIRMASPMPAAAPPAPAAAAAPAAVPAATATAVAEEDTLALEPYIDSAQCTACNECTNLNRKLFAYNAQQQAYIKDPRAGTFKELVMAAERCPVRIIHPGTPLNPKEKDLAKWVERAKPFN